MAELFVDEVPGYITPERIPVNPTDTTKRTKWGRFVDDCEYWGERYTKCGSGTKYF